MSNMIVPDFSEVGPETVATADVKEMLTITIEGQQKIVRINPSSLSVINSCPRKAFYLLELKLKSKNEGTALTAGKAIHRGLEIFYTHPSKERSLPVRFEENAILLAHDQLDAETVASHFLYSAIAEMVKVAMPLKALPDSDKRSISNLAWLMTKYFRTYINDPYVVHSDANGPLVERRVEFPIYEDPTLKVIVFGTIDVILRNEVTGVILPADHKTFSQAGNDFLNRIKPNHQYSAYLLGAQKCLGITTDEFMVNGFHVVAKPKTANAKGAQFVRQITKRSAHDFVEFEQAILWAVRSYLFWQEAKSWPIGSVDSCSMWGGCSLLDVCSAPSQLRQNILDAQYNKPMEA